MHFRTLIFTLALCTVIVSSLTNLLPSVSTVRVEKSELLNASAESDTSTWRKQLKEIPAYFKPPEEVKNTIESKPEPKSIPQQQPTEAKFVAVINMDTSLRVSGLFQLPGNSEPKALSVGEGWLEPWVIKELNANYVVWENVENSNVIEQRLF